MTTPRTIAGRPLSGSIAAALLVAVSACSTLAHGPKPPPPAPVPADASAGTALKPLAMPLAPPVPLPTGKTQTYDVSVNNLPVSDVLFVLARDANISLDVAPNVSGRVTLIATQQTLPQILDRIAEQVDMRYEFHGTTLTVTPDAPFVRHYKIDYVNIERESKSTANIATQIQATSISPVTTGGGGGSGGTVANNNSTSELKSLSKNAFWETLVANIRALIGDAGSSRSAGAGASKGSPATAPDPSGTAAPAMGSVASGQDAAREASTVIANPETGLLAVVGTSRQQKRVQAFLDVVLKSARRQVLIEATIAEVTLSDQYQQGVNWQKIGGAGNGLQLVQQPAGPAPLPGGSIPNSGPGGVTYPTTGATATAGASIPGLFLLNYTNKSATDFLGNLSAAVSLLESFGKVKVLSSPKLNVLNNQTALLKVVDNRIYFTINVQVTPGNSQTGQQALVVYTSTPATVPVGFVMSVTPEIDDAGYVTMDVRPTISRILDYVNDPNPALASANVVSKIPEIQTRELESMIRVHTGDVAVMGGLMQDSDSSQTDEVPGVGGLPLLGNLFKYKNTQRTKSELVIFLRPVVILDGSVDGDYRDYKSLVPDAAFGPQTPIDPEPSTRKPQKSPSTTAPAGE